MRTWALSAALALAAACQPASPAPTTEISLLFTQTAASGTLQEAGDGYTLTLSGVDAQTTQFADRPSRYAGVIATGGFIESWAGVFDDDSPNAALVMHEPTAEGADTLVVTLTNPLYDAAAATLRYGVTVLDGEQEPARMRGFGGARHATPPQSFGAVSLFIDDVDGTVVSGCLIQPGLHCPGADLSNANLGGADLSHSSIVGVNFANADLTGANLSNSSISGGTSFLRANLSQATFNVTAFTDADLSGANLLNATISNSTLNNVKMRGANLIGATLTGDHFVGVDLTRANLLNADIASSTFDGTVYYCLTTMPDGSIYNGTSRPGLNC